MRLSLGGALRFDRWLTTGYKEVRLWDVPFRVQGQIQFCSRCEQVKYFPASSRCGLGGGHAELEKREA